MAKVLVPLAQGCEELEAVTVIDLLRRAGIEVVVAGLVPGPVTASRKTTILPDTDLDSALADGDEYDMVVLPGGLPGADHLDNDRRIHALLARFAAQSRYIAAICAAPKVLVNAGLLAGRRATSYPGVLESFGADDITIETQAVVRDGNVITSRGPGTAMEFALSLIALLADQATADEVSDGLVRQAPVPVA